MCEKGYIRNANKICTACPANSQVSSDLSKCICNGNYKWVFNTFTCVACQANSSPIADQSDCHCNIGYSLIVFSYQWWYNITVSNNTLIVY